MNRSLNWRMRISRIILALAPGVLVLAVPVVRGLDALSLSICALAAGALLERDRGPMPAAALLACGLALIFSSEAASSALLLSVPVWSLWSSDRMPCRILYAGAVLLAFLHGSVINVLPLVPAAAVAVFLGRRWRRGTVLGAAMVIVLALGRMPVARTPYIAHASETVLDGGVSWSRDSSLDLSSPVLYLDGEADWDGILRIEYSAGGVREPGPVASVTSGDTTVLMMSGGSLLEIECRGFPVRIELLRGWKPFNHPVVHFLGAEVGHP